MESRPSGQLFDIGYQSYEGPRRGRVAARSALFVDGVRQTLGLGRGARAKILPALMLLVSIGLPAIILVIYSMGGELDAESRPVELGDYFPINTLLLLMLAGVIGPALLISDRTDNVLSLYLVRPIGMIDYLAARWLAFFLVTTVIVLAGPLLLLIGYTLISQDAAQELRDNWMDFPKVVLASAVIGAFIASIPLGVAAFAARRIYAAAIVIGGVLVISPAIGVLIEPIDFDGSSFESLMERPITEEELAEADQFLDATRSVPEDLQLMITVEFESGETTQYVMSRAEVEDALDGGIVRTFQLDEDEPEALLGIETSKWVVFIDPVGVPSSIVDLLFEDVQANNYRRLVAEHPDYYRVAAYFAWLLIPLGMMWWRYRRHVL